jgi:UDP-N-acetylglucosamine 2-epimerase
VRHHDPKAIKITIKKALSPKFRNSLNGMKNPYGDGRSAKRIVEILETIPINEKLLYKKITY